jgi:xanthine dehydrogenase accessory factor
MEFLLEPLQQDPTLVIFGAGHVGRELCRVAAQAGFQVVVVDEREEFATRERFPEATELLIDDPMAVLNQLPYGPNTYLVILTHLHRLDEDLLRALAPREYKYLGMIGSRAKVAKFLDRLRARGIPEEALSRIHMPIGLGIGAVTPAEIAISVAAELVNIRRTPGAAGAGEVSVLNWRPDASRKGDDTAG